MLWQTTHSPAQKKAGSKHAPPKTAPQQLSCNLLRHFANIFRFALCSATFWHLLQMWQQQQQRQVATLVLGVLTCCFHGYIFIVCDFVYAPQKQNWQLVCASALAFALIFHSIFSQSFFCLFVCPLFCLCSLAATCCASTGCKP